MAKAITGYYGATQIMEILNVSRSKALQILHSFERHGKLVRFGPKTLRVEISEFNKWLEQCGGKR